MIVFPRFVMVIAFLLMHFLGYSQGYKLLLRAAQDSTKSQNYKGAINLLLKAKQLKSRDRDYSDKVNMYLGNNYEALNQVDSSIFYYAKAIKFCEEKNDYASLSFLFSRLANIEFSVTKQYQKSITNFKKQLIYDKLSKDSVSIFDCLNNIGIAYKSLNQPSIALTYFNQVAESNSNHNNAKITALLLIADTYSLLKEFPKAFNYYDNAIHGLEVLKDSSNLFIAFANKGDCLMQQNELALSLMSLKKAEQFLKAKVSKANEAVLYNNFASVYSKLKIFDKAFYYKDLENKTIESINTESIGNAVAEMNAKYELRKKQDSIFISKQKLILADAKTTEKQRDFLVLLAVSIALLLFFISAYRIRQLRFRSSLEKQKSEQHALNLLHKYQLSESELKSIRSQMNPHFIFNVLNSIEAYVMENDKKTASRLIQKFAALSRLILENSTKSLVTGQKEWKALMLYTELEAMRYNDCFSYTFTLDDKINLNRILLRPMLIQPLIENAILHGLITDQRSDAHLEVTLEQNDLNFLITVKDNGIGMENLTKDGKSNYFKERSMGIESIRDRIAMMNQQQHDTVATFTISSNLNKRGTIAIISLPILLNTIEEVNF